MKYILVALSIPALVSCTNYSFGLSVQSEQGSLNYSAKGLEIQIQK